MPTLEQTLNDIQFALDQNDLVGAGTACSQAGQIFLERNLYQEAAGYYQEANQHFGAAGEDLLQSRALNHLGICLVMVENPHSALEVLQQALKLGVQS